MQGRRAGQDAIMKLVASAALSDCNGGCSRRGQWWVKGRKANALKYGISAVFQWRVMSDDVVLVCRLRAASLLY